MMKDLEDLYLYLESLKSINSIENLEKSSDVVKGIINECDFMLKSDLKPSSKFYWIYGYALREYALELLREGDEDEFINFLQFSRVQFEKGLEITQQEGSSDQQEGSSDQSSDQQDVDQQEGLKINQHDFVLEMKMMDMQELKEDLDISQLQKEIEKFDAKQMIRVGMGIKDYANFKKGNKRMEWNDFAIKILNFHMEVDMQIEQVRSDGIAQCFLSKANYYAEEEEEQEDSVCSNTEKATEFLAKGLVNVKKCLDLGDFAQGFATRGEILIYLSDINAQLGNEHVSEKYYKEALHDFKKCHELDATVLPEQFFELI